MSRTKTFILDTNVLLHNPQAISVFEDNKVIVPLSVLAELDRLKQGNQEIHRTARTVVRNIDELRSQGNLSEGIRLPRGGIFQILACPKNSRESSQLPSEIHDDKFYLAEQLKNAGEHVVIVSKNIITRLQADAVGIAASDLQKDQVQLIYHGYREYLVSVEQWDQFHSLGKLELLLTDLNPNEYVLVACPARSEKASLARAHRSGACLLKCLPPPSVLGISAKNNEQAMAIDLMLDESIDLVTLIGGAGTGKTLLALACGFYKIIAEQAYLKMLVARPIVPLGKDIGYLPGSKEKKLGHWMQPIFDNIDVLLNSGSLSEQEKIAHFVDSNLLELEAITYIRGRSIPRQFMIIDEAQNLTPHEIKTIISRAGTKTKIVLTGDPYQIDNPYLDAATNGLSYVIERLKSEPSVGHVTLEKSERSALAALAVKQL